MAPQSLDLGLSLGLGLVSRPSQPSFWYSGGNVAADQEVGPTPTAAAVEERRCSPGSPASSGSGSGLKRGAERSAGSGDEDQDDDGGNARKKLRLSKDQAAVLEECFKTHHTLTPKQKLALANSLGLRPRQVEVWFQNRRARTKLKQTEVDCEYMKRWCEQLAEQNRRLEKEVAELRALKATPPAHNGAAAGPLTTLTMCLSCKRVASTSSASACTVPSFSANAGIGMPMPSPVAQPEHRQFFCGFRDTGAAYGGPAGLTKVVKAAR
ncbi:homeobox-leucine zipper protein HOX28-like [Triticum dicoccoides]|uniref:homeobox-leucine zipper protein HOX28-like n=1 Tax=Triticum dicoccoides TaxID=85692 RepID=UPI000E7B4F0F|nr:homeobox-leucine zipper protein HOX28-like [Triticum dicoccoides]